MWPPIRWTRNENGDISWLGLTADSDAYNWRNTNTVNYWGSITGMSGDRDTVNPLNADGTAPAQAKHSGDVDGWATDLGVRLRLDPQWQVGAAYARASADYEQNGLESNRSNYTGTRSRVHRFGEAFRGEMNNMQTATLFGSWMLNDEYDASVIYHKFWRVDGNKPVGSNGINAVQNDTDDVTGAVLSSTSLPLEDGNKDLGQEMDLVVTKYFKQGLLPAALSQSIDEPSALVRLRGGVFKPGDAYGKGSRLVHAPRVCRRDLALLMRTAKGVPDMNSPKRGSITLLAGAMLLASCGGLRQCGAGPPQGSRPTMAKELQQAKTYTVSSAPTAPLELAKPKLPDTSGYTAEAIAAKIVRSKPGKISVRRMMQEDALKDFIGGDNKMAEWVVRQHGIPQAIFVDDGYMNLKDLAKKVPKQYFSETSPGVFLAKLPIVVGQQGHPGNRQADPGTAPVPGGRFVPGQRRPAVCA